jgi:CDP-diacylglycerol---serine O-phosphatidyltransferase
MMKATKLIPNFLTLLNLTCGLVSVVLVIETKESNYIWAALLIYLAAIFDWLDGTAARLFSAYSDLGKQLDSLADLVSFGVAPGIIMFRILSNPALTGSNILERLHIIPYLALLIPLLSAIRLAKFNIDPRQEVNFVGLPTPANALFFASIPLILSIQPNIFTLFKLTFLVNFFSNAKVLTILVLFFSYLLISDFRLFSMKFKTWTFSENRVRYIFLATVLFLIILFSLGAIPLIILAYLLLSMFFQEQIR